jgi:hypothetical protein
MESNEMNNPTPAIEDAIADTHAVPATHAGIEWYRRQLYRTECALADATAVNQDLKTENANLRQEAVELHELLAVANETIGNLERSLQTERGLVRLAIDAAGLFSLTERSRRMLRVHNAVRIHNAVRMQRMHL